jgi:Fic family protein
MAKIKINQEDVKTFLKESNYIESEFSEIGYEDSLKAWEKALYIRKVGMFLIGQVHQILAGRLNPRIAGTLRQCNVTVGGRICPNWEKVPALLAKWVRKYRGVRSSKLIKEAHVEFEKIHPFEDFNGRTGRIIYNLMRAKAGLSIHIIYEKDKFEYYKWFEDGNAEMLRMIDFYKNN